jgi:hypothetical protein
MLKSVSSITNALGALNYKGTWDANANSPALTSSVGTKGDYYVVGTAGSTNLNGISNWGVGDWVAFNGSVWQRVEGGADLNGVNLSVSGTSTLSGLTASTGLALNASKNIVSVVNPTFSAYGNAAQTLATDVFTKVVLNAEDYDTNNNFDSTTNYRFTPTVAGYYQLNLKLTVATTSTLTLLIAEFRKNGSGATNGRGLQFGFSVGTFGIFNATNIMYFNGVSDYCEIWLYMSGAGTLTTSSADKNTTFFQGSMIRSDL